MAHKYSIAVREFGRGKPDINRFATLDDAARYIKARWQGLDYLDHDKRFHTDYCTYELRGFSITQLGKYDFSHDPQNPEFIFNNTPPLLTH